MDGVPLPAQAPTRRPAAADPRQQPRRGHLDGHPHRRSSCSCSSCRGRRSTRSTPVSATPRPGSAPSPASSSGVRVPRRDRPDARRRCTPQLLPIGEDGGMVVPVGDAGAADARQPGRHPRLLRPAVPVQARRRPGPDQQVRVHGRGAIRRPTFRGQCAELCGAGPRRDAVRRPCLPRPTTTPGSRTRSPTPTPRRRPSHPAGHRCAEAGQSAGPGRGGVEHRLQTDEPGGSGRHAVHDRLRQQGRRAFRTTSRSTKEADRTRRSSRARSSRASPRRTTTSRRSPAGTYGFICTVHPNMTGTLTVK